MGSRTYIQKLAFESKRVTSSVLSGNKKEKIDANMSNFEDAQENRGYFVYWFITL